MNTKKSKAVQKVPAKFATQYIECMGTVTTDAIGRTLELDGKLYKFVFGRATNYTVGSVAYLAKRLNTPRYYGIVLTIHKIKLPECFRWFDIYHTSGPEFKQNYKYKARCKTDFKHSYLLELVSTDKKGK